MLEEEQNRIAAFCNHSFNIDKLDSDGWLVADHKGIWTRKKRKTGCRKKECSTAIKRTVTLQKSNAFAVERCFLLTGAF